MNKIRFCLLSVMLLLPLMAQAQNAYEVDYGHPQKYFLGGISVEGNNYFSDQQIIQLTGLQEGMEVTIPSDALSSIVTRLWSQRFFDDISVEVDHFNDARDSVFLKILIEERPRVSRWTFTGVKKGEQKELLEKLHVRRGGEFSDYVAEASTNVIKKFYAEKGFLNCKVNIDCQQDTVIKNATRVNFDVDKGQKVKIKTINFYGNDDVKEFKLARSMKKTKSAKIYNFFSSKKFNEKEYEKDKKNLISTFNEAGYRDARLLKDSIYYVEPNRLGVDFTFDQGDKYYFRDISWTGNSVYPTDVLNKILSINKGDVYDVVTMEKRLLGGGKQTDYDVSTGL